MSVNVNAIGASSGPVGRRWTADDALLYALAVGACADGPASDELKFTTENTAGTPQQVLPTFVVIPAMGVGNLAAQFGDFDRAKLVHAEQSLELAGPLPVAAEVTAESRIAGVWDKGSGAVIETATTLHDVSTGALMAITCGKVFIRGEGGWGGDRGPAAPPPPPSRQPDHAVSYQTLPAQALIYRLTGDRNPLHSDPVFAARGGFPRPILHGLCTFGFTGRALLHKFCGSDPARFRSMSGRFSKPVLPGDTLTVCMWRIGDGEAAFRTMRGDDVVLDGGRLTFAAGDSRQ
jgi:acyl dehydratase